MYEDTRHRVWYALHGYEGHYFCVDNGQLREYSGLPRGAIVCYQDRDGWFWLSHDDGRVASWKDGHLRPVSEFSTPFIFMPLEDKDGGFWIATFNAGLFHRRHLFISCLRRPGPPELSSTLLTDAQGRIWVGSLGLERLGDSGGPAVRLDRPFRSAVTALFEDRDGTFYVGSFHGLASFRAGRFLQDARLASTIEGRVFSIQRDRAGQLWIGSDDGLYGFDGQHVCHYGGSEGLDGSSVSVIHEGRAGNLWVGTHSGLFVRRGGEHFSEFHDSAGKTVGQIVSLFEDSSRVLWVGTYGQGLCRIAGHSFTRYTTRQGLVTNMVYNLVEDDGGFLWFGSASGLVRASKAALNDYAAGKSKYIFSTIFGKADGLLNLDVSSLGQPGALKARDGKLWFATTSPYLAIVDPVMAEDKSHPSVYIDDCEIDGRPRLCDSELKVTPRDTEIQIRYSALGFSRPEQFRFKYKLDGLNSDWTYVGSRRIAYFSRPPSGSYLLRVAVANGDGVWNPEQATLRLTIRPAFYATLAFRTALFGLIAVVAAAAWTYRIRRLRRAQAAQQAFARQLIASQEAERQRIAAELHDSLGQRLILIKNLALVSSREMKEPGTIHGHIEEISSQASGANRELKEIAYNLRPYQLDRMGLTKAIQSLAESIREACGIATLVHIDDIDDAFRKDLEINFYRIVQEALNNVVKHSQASEVTMVIERTKDFLNLTVRDNGKGGAPNITDGNISSRGFGVTGMIERGYLLGGKTVIHSVQGQGTTVTVEIALDSKRT